MRFKIITTIILTALLSSPAFSADLSAPLIDLPRVKQPESPDSALIIKAIVDDDVAVGSVKLFYRIAGKNSKFSSISLKPSKENPKYYIAELPVEINDTKGIEYYVEARDLVNNITQEPFPNKPKQFYFQDYPSKANTPTNSLYFNKGLFGGASVSYGVFTIDDPQGDTGTSGAPSAAAIIGYAPNRLWRGFASLNYQKFSLPYSQTEIGQDVSSIHIDLMIQRAIPLFNNTSWVGFGIGLEKNKVTGRGTELNNTFVNKFDDRNETGYGLVLDFGYEIAPVKSSTVGINAKFYKTLDNGLDGLLLGLFVLFD